MASQDDLDYNVEVFNDTCSKCDDDDLCLKKYISDSLSEQEIILEDGRMPHTRGYTHEHDTEIVVSKLRSMEAAAKYKGEHIAVLNFADWFKPGGEVLIGLPTQEEALCRVSTLYRCIRTPETLERFYHRHRGGDVCTANDDIIYTPDVYVFKEDRFPNGMLPESERFFTDVITCAAPNLAWKDMEDGELERIHMKRLDRILSVAYEKGVTHVILGAFGCGAFGNNPYVVAKAHRKVLSEWKGRFKVVEYPVFCESHESENYRAFKEILG